MATEKKTIRPSHHRPAIAALLTAGTLVLPAGIAAADQSQTGTTGARKATVITVSTSAAAPLSYEGMPKRLKPGRYIFRYTNNSALNHDLRVGDRKTPVFSSGTRKIRVTLTRGKVRYLCTVPGHAAAGMKGRIRVK